MVSKTIQVSMYSPIKHHLRNASCAPSKVSFHPHLPSAQLHLHTPILFPSSYHHIVVCVCDTCVCMHVCVYTREHAQKNWAFFHMSICHPICGQDILTSPSSPPPPLPSDNNQSVPWIQASVSIFSLVYFVH